MIDCLEKEKYRARLKGPDPACKNTQKDNLVEKIITVHINMASRGGHRKQLHGLDPFSIAAPILCTW